VRQRNWFDPWGNYPIRYDTIYGKGNDSTPQYIENYKLNFPLTFRGFTGHEHYPQFKIINMNGRLYDPVIARFFSPDKYVQQPYFTQSFNRYTYALNNPLKYVDRTGQWYNEYDDYDDPNDPIVLNEVNVHADRPEIDDFNNFRGREDNGTYNEELRDFNEDDNPPGKPGQFRMRFDKSLSTLYRVVVSSRNKVPYTSNTSGNGNGDNGLLPAPSMNHFDTEGVVLVPISDEYVGTVGLAGTGVGQYSNQIFAGVGVGLSVVAASKIPYVSPIASISNYALGFGQLTYSNKINPTSNKNERNFHNFTTTIGTFGGLQGSVLALIIEVTVPPAADYLSRKMTEFGNWWNNQQTWSNWYFYGP
jgi:RHS repeat-associated protein